MLEDVGRFVRWGVHFIWYFNELRRTSNCIEKTIWPYSKIYLVHKQRRLRRNSRRYSKTTVYKSRFCVTWRLSTSWMQPSTWTTVPTNPTVNQMMRWVTSTQDRIIHRTSWSNYPRQSKTDFENCHQAKRSSRKQRNITRAYWTNVGTRTNWRTRKTPQKEPETEQTENEDGR